MATTWREIVRCTMRSRGFSALDVFSQQAIEDTAVIRAEAANSVDEAVDAISNILRISASIYLHGGQHGNHRQPSQALYGGANQTSGAGAGTFGSVAQQRAAAFQAATAKTSALQNAQGAGLMGAGGWFLGGVHGHGLQYFSNMRALRASYPNFLSNDEPDHDGIVMGEITAWRAWRVDAGNLVISSMVVDEVWMPGAVIEGDTKGAYGVGVHAFKKPGGAIAQYSGRVSIVVVGQIELWGEITEHEDGYRAQYGTPATFDFIYQGGLRGRRLLKKLRAKYFGAAN